MLNEFFREHYPDVESITVEGTEFGSNVDPPAGGTAMVDFSFRDGRVMVLCSNRLCRNGGIRLGGTILGMVSSKETEHEVRGFCPGSEGSPKLHRIYRKCMNHFRLKITITYKSGDADKAS